MIDFNNLSQYRENNCIEVKKALGGVPKSVWETYSSFANTQGGIILLGVGERKDHTFELVDLPDPEKLVKDFWDGVNNPTIVSVNILSNRQVEIHEVEGKHIVSITVPKADRRDRPVYLGTNPLTGAYRRNGEGDYRCTREEVQMMLRDQSERSQDMLVLDKMGLDVFDYDSVKRYRNRMRINRPGHVWEDFDDTQFLYRLGAVGRAEDGSLHPTAAGLLMFGFDFEIVREFPNYFLDYQEHLDESTRWTDRLNSGTGEWSGNLYDFYFRVYHKLVQDIKVPFKLRNGLNRVDDTPIHEALREALANCLINADYHGRQGLVVIKKPKEITLSNPGSFRIDLKDALSGGVSDPRNATLIKMFNLVNIGERSGSGIPKIFAAWKNQGWTEPKLEESFEPDRTKLTLEIVSEKVAIKTGDKKVATNTGDKKLTAKAQQQREKILAYLEEQEEATAAQLCEVLGVKSSRIKQILQEMAADELILVVGEKKNRTYRKK